MLTLLYRIYKLNNKACSGDLPWTMVAVGGLEGLQWFNVTLAGAGRGTLPFPGACDVEVEDWTDLSVVMVGTRRAALVSRCQTDDVWRRRVLTSSSLPPACAQYNITYQLNWWYVTICINCSTMFLLFYCVLLCLSFLSFFFVYVYVYVCSYGSRCLRQINGWTVNLPAAAAFRLLTWWRWISEFLHESSTDFSDLPGCIPWIRAVQCCIVIYY